MAQRVTNCIWPSTSILCDSLGGLGPSGTPPSAGTRFCPKERWPNFTLGNHDQSRHIWRYRDRDPSITEARAKVAAAMLLTLRGTPFLYYGEEIGMTCVRLPRASLRDPVGIKTWPLGFIGRDPERTPMQWDDSPGGGFGSASPWLPLNPDWRNRNVAAQLKEPDSLLSWYKSLIAVRRAEGALRRGSIRFLEAGGDILAFERLEEVSGDCVEVFLNFSSRGGKVATKEKLIVLLGSRREAGSVVDAGEPTLAPCEVLIARRAV